MKGPFGMVPRELAGDRSVSAAAVRVYVVVASFANGARVAYPGRAQIAEACGTTERTVQRHLAVLVKRGYLTRRGGGYRGRAVTFALNSFDPKVVDKSGKGDARRHPFTPERETSDDRKGDVYAPERETPHVSPTDHEQTYVNREPVHKNEKPKFRRRMREPHPGSHATQLAAAFSAELGDHFDREAWLDAVVVSGIDYWDLTMLGIFEQVVAGYRRGIHDQRPWLTRMLTAENNRQYAAQNLELP